MKYSIALLGLLIFIGLPTMAQVDSSQGDVIIIDNGRIKAADTPKNLVASMRAAGRISVEIKADDPEVVAGAFSRLEHVKKVTHEAVGDGWIRLQILVDSGTDTRERLHQLTVQYGWPLRSIFRHKATLEDVFVELTRQD